MPGVSDCNRLLHFLAILNLAYSGMDDDDYMNEIKENLF